MPDDQTRGGWFSSHFELAGGVADRNLPMEGLRGVAVLLVFFVHYSTEMMPRMAAGGFTHALASALFIVGNTGVDLFFVLSGYLIYGTLIAKARPYFKFLGRRVERIYPAFLVVFALYLLIGLAMPQVSKLPKDGLEVFIYLLANLLLLPGMFPMQPLIQVAWSLSYEFFFYLVCPLVISLVGLRSAAPRTRVAVIAAASVFWLAWSYAFGASHVRMALFGSGMLLYEVCANRLLIARHALGLPALVTALVGYFLMVTGRAESVAAFSLLYVCFFVLCHEAFTRRGLTARLLATSALRWLGNMSYSFYLLHGLMIHAFFFAFKAVVPAKADQDALYFVLLIPVFLVALAGSACLFLLVERRFSLKAPAGTGRIVAGPN